MERLVFLVDMNAFFISCETVRHPHLKGKPAAVAGDPQKRTGIILAANYVARDYGVRTAMSVYQALKLCPDLELVAPDHEFYSEKSKEIMSLLARFSPIIEQNSIDEAWLDMTGSYRLFGPPLQAAKSIQTAMETDLGLWCSIGISNGKFLAKMAAEMKKPRGITSLFPTDLEEKLWPLPVEKIYGVGKRTASRLHEMGLFTIGDLARSDPKLLAAKLGKAGVEIHKNVNGLDMDPVKSHDRSEVKSVGKSITLSQDLTSLEAGKEILLSLSDQVGRRARRLKKAGTTVQITIKYSDFKTITRQQSLAPTNSTMEIYHSSIRLLEANWKEDLPIRLLGVTLADFSQDTTKQISMFEESESPYAANKKSRELDAIMDQVREKYGSKSLIHAIQLHKNKNKK